MKRYFRNIIILMSTIGLVFCSSIGVGATVQTNTEAIQKDILSYNNETQTLSVINVPGVWRQSSDGRWWYQHNDGSYTKKDWELIGGKWYYFDGNGWMVTGWLQLGDKWYYLNPSGDMRTGWFNQNGSTYYFDDNGLLVITQLGVNRIRQAKSNWCWAAASQMVGNYDTSSSISQYDIVSRLKGSSLPNVGGYVPDMVNGTYYASGNSKGVSATSDLAAPQAVGEINERNPFIISMAWYKNNDKNQGFNGEGHAIVCSGYNLQSNTLFCIDPWENVGNSYYSWTGLRNGMTIQTGSGEWTDTIKY